jgi:hypothetical protein
VTLHISLIFQSTLQSVVTDIIASDLDLEVDPSRLSNPDQLPTNRLNLRTVVRQVWGRIANSHSNFPFQVGT